MASTPGLLDEALGAAPEDIAAARRLARRYSSLDAGDLDAMLWNEPVGPRLVAVLVLVQHFRDGSDTDRAGVLDQFLTAAHGERLDSRMLVDAGAEHIVGGWYLERNRNPLFALAKSDIVWERRIAVLATLAFVKHDDAAAALDVVGRVVRERSDEIQTAVGLVLREVGKRADPAMLRSFLASHESAMGATALAIAAQRLA